MQKLGERGRFSKVSGYIQSGSLTSDLETELGIKHLISITGDPSNASIVSMWILLPLMDSIRHMERAIKLGLTGEWVAKTPLNGLFLFFRG